MKLKTKHVSILLVIMLFSISCEKATLETEPSISDITQKLRTNTAMGELVISLVNTRDENQMYSNSNLKDKDKVESYKNLIIQAKSKEEMISIFNSAGINNSKLLVNKMYFQNAKLAEIYQSVSELKLLSVDDKKKMFSELFKELFLTKKINKDSRFISNKKMPDNITVKDMGCYDTFNLDMYGCEMTYNAEMAGIWVVVLAGSTLTGELALAPLVGTGLALSGIAFLMREVCYNTSTASFTACVP